MSPRTYASTDGTAPPGTLCTLFLDAVDRFGDAPALRRFTGRGDEMADLSYDEVAEQAREIAAGLAFLGIEAGDRVALLSENRPEWAIADYACLLAGIVDVPVYSTLIAQQIAYILENSGARAVFASTREQVDKALAAADEAGLDLTVIAFEPVSTPSTRVVQWDDLRARGRERLGDTPASEFEAAARAIGPEDVATILYTSGTTGNPKGVMLTHGNLHSNVWACANILDVGPDDVTLSFLPLSHVLQRMVDYLLLTSGCTLAYARDIRNVAEDLRVVRPTVAVSVPRLYEKVYNKVMDAEGVKLRLIRWATAVGREWADAVLDGASVGPFLAARRALADRLVYRKIREGVGGRLRWFVSGGAPLEPAIARFFFSVGRPILEGYGLTETSPVTNVNPRDAIRIGTVGPPVPGTEIRIADDGEILVRGPQVMKGYYGRPEDTAAVIDGEGWFATGDVGELTDDGYLRITDRKKDIIVTAGGKNIAPQPIENRLKTNPFVEQVVMVGDKRKFPGLLLVPAFGPLEAWARANGVAPGDRRTLLQDPTVQAHMEREVVEHLGELSRYETPKKIALLADEFTIEAGTLTPSMKVRRRVVQERFADLIDRFYDEANEHRSVFTE
ncbi:MAG: long-chain fatty acid--CoA ligase [Gemmatimonadetes bacterium]|nr:long-chain fatty acid--CoA ligase [Gemmatimonadota bacterium]